MSIERVGVVGLGTMGAGIAQVCVQAGVETVGREVNDELAERTTAGAVVPIIWRAHELLDLGCEADQPECGRC